MDLVSKIVINNFQLDYKDIFIDFGPTSWQQFIDEIANLTVEIHYLSQQEMNYGKDRYTMTK